MMKSVITKINVSVNFRSIDSNTLAWSSGGIVETFHSLAGVVKKFQSILSRLYEYNLVIFDL